MHRSNQTILFFDVKVKDPMMMYPLKGTLEEVGATLTGHGLTFVQYLAAPRVHSGQIWRDIQKEERMVLGSLDENDLEQITSRFDSISQVAPIRMREFTTSEVFGRNILSREWWMPAQNK